MENVIKIRGARQHNLKNINLDIPKNKLVVLTGVSGSGKSSLAFDTIYAEGQRRYVESLSTYARQFLGIMEKPDVDLIEGLSPAISIDQKTTSRNPRSTVGTVTEIYDYLRLLFARVGHPHCPICGREISSQSLDEIVQHAMQLIKEKVLANKKARFLILAPIVVDKKGEFSSLFDNLKAKGFRQVRVDKQVRDLEEDLYLIKTNKHTIEAVVDRFSLVSADLKQKVFEENLKSRFTDSIEQALKLTDGNVIFAEITDKTLDLPKHPKEFEDHLFSEKFACPIDNIQIPEIEPRTFSFNSPHGACPTCSGLGKILKVEPYLVFSDEISITEGAILPFGNMFENDTWFSRLVNSVCDENGIDPKIPLKFLSENQQKLLLEGTGDREYRVEGTNRFGKNTYIYEAFKGVIAELERRYTSTESEWVKSEIEKYMRENVCPECLGARLKKEALSITIDKRSIYEITEMPTQKCYDWIVELTKNPKLLSEKEKGIGTLILNEIKLRLNFLISVGLEYLTLNRSAVTLSGGEAQRIRLASQIGSGLTGVLYVLDEPTIGLHQKDNAKLIETLKKLRDLGNTVLVVEHAEEMMHASDEIIDFGPGAGKFGGEVIAKGDFDQIIKNTDSITGNYLAHKKTIDIRKHADGNGKELKLVGCTQFNLKNINVNLPLGKLVLITGVSGSGKSTLLVETLYPAIASSINPLYRGATAHLQSIEGLANVNKVVLIDQSPIGKTPRSNPATYTKVFDSIRDVFAQTKDARASGYKKGRFSFNVKGGRCEACEGQGQTKIEMQFMSDIWITCEVCKGRRYNANTLEVTYRGKNIADVLKMTVSEAVDFFHAHPSILAKLETLQAVGLEYIELGQPATTLSGGESQRVKLSSELAKRATGDTVYILDEPTTGLHFADIQKLLNVLSLLVEKGNSVFVIEHNLDVIKNADWIVDMGPEGGDKGGEIIASGTLSDIIKNKKSYTAQFLSRHIL